MTEAENLPAVAGETEIDNGIVQEAISQINYILTENFGNASYQVVDYLLESFFDGNQENLKTKKLDGNKSFQGLLTALQDETGKSKAWLYEAIKLWLDREYFKGLDQTTNEQYLQLSISHRALLLKVSDPKKKKGFANDFYANKVTYKEAKEMVRGESPNTEYSLLSRLINHPDDFEDDFKEKASKVFLKKTYNELNKSQQTEILEKANRKIIQIEKVIAEQQAILDKVKVIESKLQDISKSLPDPQ